MDLRNLRMRQEPPETSSKLNGCVKRRSRQECEPMTKTRFSTLIPLVLVSLAGCRAQEGLTSAEATQASEELQVESQSQALTSSTVELGTNFTIGGAVEK